MRLLLTAVVGGRPQDLAIDAEDDATVGDLATALAERLPADALRPTGPAHEHLPPPPPQLTVVRGSAPDPATAAGQDPAARDGGLAVREGGAARQTGPARLTPALYLGSHPLDPRQPLAASPVRHGALVGVGGPVPDILAEPRGLVEVRISSGPGAGLVTRLSTGDHVVGTGADAAVRLPDIGLPAVCLQLRVRPDGTVELTPEEGLGDVRQHPPPRTRPLPGPIVLDAEAEIRRRRAGESTYQELPPGTRVLSPDDPMPLVHLDREPVTAGQTWEPGQALVVGPCLLELTVPTRPDASLSASPQGATVDYNRPPRLLPPPRQTEFHLPQEPKRPLNQPLPWPFLMMPLVMGPVLYLVFQRWQMLIFMGLMPLMALANFASGRTQAKRRYNNEFAEYTQRMRRAQQQALVALQEERAARRRDFADPGEILVTAVGPRARLWERRRTDPDWLVARVGTADQPSSVTIKTPLRERHEGDLVWTAPDVPVTVELAEAGVTGIAGPARRAIARWVLGQVATLHSPVDVELVLLTTPDTEADWRWARWLPHLRPEDGAEELAQVGVDEATTQARIAELARELDRRLAATRENRGAASFDPLLVVLDGSRRLRLLPGMIPLLQAGPSVQMYFLALDEDHRLLPEECRAVVQADEPWMTVRVTEQDVVEAVRPDLVGPAWAERLARALSPVRDVSTEDAAATIPTSSRLLDVIRLDPPTGEGVLERWRRTGRTTTAVIGEGADGLFAVDLVRDGPHGLVAGTTGSGKSELLQTLIASLAVENRPDEMTFVLVDYKGGAAFKDCNRLPHTVGMVTDLDGHLTSRALESLGAELRRREHQLAAADAKDIEDYLAARGPDDPPMPRLLIVIDEFAALVAELPDFVTGLVDIARRGRSLGVHLILATQRPAGVVSAEIKSNTNLRIALRVTDATDSTDVIEAPDAAHIAKSTPGRAYARLGHSSLIPFQSSRVGGRPRGEGRVADVRLRGMEFATLGAAPPALPQAEEDASVPTDLAALVAAAQEASRLSGIPTPPSPWLPPLPESLTLDDVLAEFPDAVPSADRLVIPLGMVDLPSEQRRGVATYDLAEGSHLAVAGAPRSGRSTVLRAVAGAIGRYLSPEDVHVYGVDCGNNALLPLVALPHVGAVVSRDQTDRMDRLTARLRGLVSQRQQLLAEQGFADVAEQRRHVPPEQRLPYVVVLFDRWEGFFQAYDALDGGRLVQAWQQLIQEGAAVGLRVVMTGDRSLTLGRMSTLLDDKMVLRMIDPSDFQAVGLTPREVPTSMPDGRAFRGDGARETQVALLAEDPAGTAQVAALQAIGREAQRRFADLPRERRPFRVDVLPVRVTLREARELAAEEQAAGRRVPATALPVAVGGDTLGVRYLDAVEHGPAALVTGARRSGRSTVLRTLAVGALERGWNVIVVTPRVSPLRDLVGLDRVHGPFDASGDQMSTKELFARLREEEAPLLTLVDDLELVGADGWLADLVGSHIDAVRDTESIVVGAGSPAELQGMYRGPATAMKRSGNGIMLAPQAPADADVFGVRVNRSVLGQSMPPGGGYLVSTGQVERVQVIWPD